MTRINILIGSNENSDLCFNDPSTYHILTADTIFYLFSFFVDIFHLCCEGYVTVKRKDHAHLMYTPA